MNSIPPYPSTRITRLTGEWSDPVRGVLVEYLFDTFLRSGIPYPQVPCTYKTVPEQPARDSADEYLAERTEASMASVSCGGASR